MRCALTLGGAWRSSWEASALRGCPGEFHRSWTAIWCACHTSDLASEPCLRQEAWCGGKNLQLAGALESGRRCSGRRSPRQRWMGAFPFGGRMSPAPALCNPDPAGGDWRLPWTCWIAPGKAGGLRSPFLQAHPSAVPAAHLRAERGGTPEALEAGERGLHHLGRPTPEGLAAGGPRRELHYHNFLFDFFGYLGVPHGPGTVLVQPGPGAFTGPGRCCTSRGAADALAAQRGDAAGRAAALKWKWELRFEPPPNTCDAMVRR